VPGFGATIRAKRKPLMTQVEFGKACAVSQSLVSQWERDESMPTGEQLVMIARVLKCSVEDLVIGVDPQYDQQRREIGGAVPQTEAGAHGAHQESRSKSADAARDRPLPQPKGHDPQHETATRLERAKTIIDDLLADVRRAADRQRVARQTPVARTPAPRHPRGARAGR
jgi:transcriptional regulator with XRE-family HTH domain